MPGAGSRGGKVIGQTKTGKPIYDSHNHSGHADFSPSEHKQAAKVSEKLSDQADDKAGMGGSPEGNKHYERASAHRDAANKAEMSKKKAPKPPSKEKFSGMSQGDHYQASEKHYKMADKHEKAGNKDHADAHRKMYEAHREADHSHRDHEKASEYKNKFGEDHPGHKDHKSMAQEGSERAHKKLQEAHDSHSKTMKKSINEEIEELAKAMEESTMSPKDQLLKTISELGSEGLKEKLLAKSEDGTPLLSDDDREVLKGALEEMKKSKSPSMDANYSAPVIRGNIKDTELEEEIASDDADEKLMKPSNASIQHQGDSNPEAFEGQVIKAKKSDIDIADDADETADEAVDKVKKSDDCEDEVEEHEKEMHSEKKDMKKMDKCDMKMKKSEDEDLMVQVLQKAMGELGFSKEECIAKCVASGYDEAEISELIEKAAVGMPKDNTIGSQKGDVKMNPEEDQDGDTDKATEGKVRSKKEKAENLMEGEDNKAAQDKVDDLKQGKMKKSAVWNEEDALLKAGRGGQNHHFSVNNYYDEAIEKAEAGVEEENELKKSSDELRDEKPDLNDLIAKSMDTTWGEELTKSELAKNEEKVNGKFVKSFEDIDIMTALGLTEEEAKKILG